jgi:hypothetical protein
MPETNTPDGSTGNTDQNANGNPQYVTQDAFNGTAAIISRMNKTLESIINGMLSLDKLADIGLVEKAADGTFKPKTSTAAATVKKDGQPDPVAEMEAKFQAELKKRDDALAAERRKAADTEQRSTVIEALTKAGAVNPSRDVVHLTGITRNDAGQFVQKTKDQYGADVEVSLEDAVGNFLKVNPELKKASGHPGSGTPAGNNTPGFMGGKDVSSLASLPMDQYFAQRKAGKL